MKYVLKSYRMATEILRTHEREYSDIMSILDESTIDMTEPTRPQMTSLFKNLFSLSRWDCSVDVSDEHEVASGKMTFMRGRVGVQVSFTHYLFIGTELLRFQMLSFSDQDLLDAGVYISITDALSKLWGKPFFGSITFEKATAYYEHLKGIITVPMLFVGLLADKRSDFVVAESTGSRREWSKLQPRPRQNLRKET